MDSMFHKKPVRVGLAAYGVVLVFVLSDVGVSLARHSLRWSTSIQPAVIALAALLASPVALALVWERLVRIKVFNVEVELSEVTHRLDWASAAEIQGYEPESMEESTFDTIRQNILKNISSAIEKHSADLVGIDIGSGSSWWSTSGVSDN